MGERKRSIVGESDDTYSPPRLFPDFEDHPHWDEQREYVQREFLRMARDGVLSLTACLAQRPAVSEIVRFVIMGLTFDGEGDARREVQINRPEELETIRVRVKAINGAPTVRWKEGQAVRSEHRRQRVRNVVKRYGDQLVDTELAEDNLTLIEALYCLQQSGRNVRRAVRRETQGRVWKTEEVGVIAPPQTERRKRVEGRAGGPLA